MKNLKVKMALIAFVSVTWALARSATAEYTKSHGVMKTKNEYIFYVKNNASAVTAQSFFNRGTGCVAKSKHSSNELVVLGVKSERGGIMEIIKVGDRRWFYVDSFDYFKCRGKS